MKVLRRLHVVEGQAYHRSDARLHILAQHGPLADTMMKIYMYGDCAVLAHWKKELAACIKNMRNVRLLKKGKLIKPALILNTLDVLCSSENIKEHWNFQKSDPEYAKMVRVQTEMPTTELYAQALTIIALGVVGENSVWDTDAVIRLLTEAVK